jgi:NADPH:quinone reductase-like Zn-dependent oxidoreductase
MRIRYWPKPPRRREDVERMKAAVRYRYGTPDVVSVEDIERPIPSDDQVLVQVRAASVNRGDLDGIIPRPAFVKLFMGLRAPRNPRIGLDVAGVVESVGPGVTRFQAGDKVFADLFSFGQGAFAEYVCAPERAFLPMPEGMTFDEAATLPHSAVLALQGLRLRDGRTFRPGDKVLIDGASGSVGPFAVQIAKTMGAEVTGVCRTEKVDFVKAVGADHVLDYTAVDYTRMRERYHWILDTDSHHSIFEVRRALRADGVYVTLGGTSWPIIRAVLLAPLVTMAGSRRMGLLLWWKPFDPGDVERLKELIAAGKVKPYIDRRFPLSQVASALRWVDEGHARGKVVITF